MYLNVDKIICNLLLFLLLVYFSQGVFYGSGTSLTSLSILIIIGISFFYLLRFIYREKFRDNKFAYVWLVFLIINIFYFIVKGDFDKISHLKPILINMVPFFTFYYFSKNGILNRKMLIWFTAIISPMIILKFTLSLSNLLVEEGKDNVVDNTVYMIMGLLPFIFIFKNRNISLFFLGSFVFFSIQSSKRAAIISGFFVILYFFFYLYKSGTKKFRLLYYFYITALVYVLVIWLSNYFLEQEYLLLRLQSMLEGDSSGRDRLVDLAFNSWYNSEKFFVLIFGNGFLTTLEVSNQNSHNDWIEVLSSFGIVGFLVFLMLFYYGFKEFFNKKRSFENKITLLSLFTIGLIASITSRWYASSFGYTQLLLLPYLLVNKKLK